MGAITGRVSHTSRLRLKGGGVVIGSDGGLESKLRTNCRRARYTPFNGNCFYYPYEEKT